MGTFEGRLTWLIRQGSEWLLGDVVGDIFADAVLEAWSVLYPAAEVPDSWWV